MAESPLPGARVLPVLMVLSGLSLIALAVGGAVMAGRGDPPPSHPFAEATLGALGVSSLLGAFSSGARSRGAGMAQATALVLSTVGALLWAYSAFGGLSGS